MLTDASYSYVWWLVWAVPLPVPLTSDPLTGLMVLLAEVEVVVVDLCDEAQIQVERVFSVIFYKYV